MKRLPLPALLALVSICFAQPVHAVDGLSGGKVVAPVAEALGEGEVELEGGYEFFRASKFIDATGTARPLGGRLSEQALALRATFGAAENFELGAAFSIFHSEDATALPAVTDTGMSDLGLGAQYVFGFSDQLAAGLRGGVSLPTSSSMSAFGGHGGVVLSASFADVWTADLDFEAGGTTAGRTETGNARWFLAWNAALGYSPLESLELTLEWNALHEHAPGGPTAHVHMVTPGCIWSVNESVALTTGVSFVLPVLSRNTDQAMTFVSTVAFVQ
ncbi:MAG: hypothetical protein KDH09_08845 [Chrysiogenetes bacterium]|nr:hypothetical protein [Chrysiogenetes bacterium]